MIQVGSEVGFDVSNKDDELSNFLSNHNDRILFLSPSVPSKFSYIGLHDKRVRHIRSFVDVSHCYLSQWEKRIKISYEELKTVF